LNQHRADLVHVDAVLRLFAPDIAAVFVIPACAGMTKKKRDSKKST
jgi:hypothetical protein